MGYFYYRRTFISVSGFRKFGQSTLSLTEQMVVAKASGGGICSMFS